MNILEYLESSFNKYPEKIAFSDETNKLSFRRLLHEAKSIGTFLLKKACINKPVFVICDRTVNSITMFHGVLYSGNFYVPVDCSTPPSRLETMIKIMTPIAILTEESNLELCKGFNIETYIYENIILANQDETGLESTRNRLSDTCPMYATFTSGSTGVPKCIVKSHRSLMAFIEAFTKLFNLDDKVVFGNQMPFSFDASTKDIYSTLKCGASTNIIQKKLFSFPVELIKHLNEEKVSCIIWSPSILNIVAKFKTFNSVVPVYLSKIMFVGEVMPVKQLNEWRKHLPKASFVNLYGATETAGNCLYYEIDHDFQENEKLPIGKTIPNATVFILNELNKEAQQGEIGEICVAGSFLALGYYNSVKKTNEVFIQNPLNKKYRETIYKTGDLGTCDKFGVFWFHGRKDNQIKHMGYRIELDEIEIAANSIGEVDVACCLYDNKSEKIVLFYQAATPCNKDIAIKLRDILPKYMMPNKIIYYEKLPYNNNKKIDRVKLKETLPDYI